MKMKGFILSALVGRETVPWKTNWCCLSLETAWCQKKKHVTIVCKGGYLFSNSGPHLGNLINNIQISLFWERRDLMFSVICS